MRMNTTLAIMCLGLSFGAASPGFSQSIALLIGNEDYDRTSDVRRGDEVTGAERPLAQVGVQVVAQDGVDLRDLVSLLSEFGQMTARADGMLVALSGRFVYSTTETFFLPTDAEPQSLVTLPGRALPLSTVLAWLSSVPGNAVLVLATDETTGEFGPYLKLGIGAIDLPQGVTLIRGETRAVARFVEGTLATPGRAIVPAAARAGLSVSGYTGRDQAYLRAAAPAVTAAPKPQAVTNDDERVLRDRLAWRRAESLNSADGYRAYINANPDGQFVAMARNRMAAFDESPTARAERIEQSLDLTRDQRREIQRDLSLLDYNTRGIDGIFGRGTRTALASWQGDNGVAKTGFLDREQITRLDAQAERRAAELQDEAERRRRQLQAQDEAFWDETGSLGDEAGLRAYLNRYPDGDHAAEARENLNAIERQKRGATDARDRQLWDEARIADTVSSYQDYLEVAPRGAFRDEAQTRITELRSERDSANSAAAREEQALNLTTTTARVIEGRLEALGLNPGPVDGRFDNDTRRALRRYQSARNLPETGYLSEQVVVQLLADSVRSIFQ